MDLYGPLHHASVVSVNTTLVFAGGLGEAGEATDVIWALNVKTKNVTTARLSTPRCRMGASLAGSKVPFCAVHYKWEKILLYIILADYV